MDGAENYDFFRQPDFVPDPFLKGSYAVYKKETLLGESTGKLCHIHRPLIIDAMGRRCWGTLSIVENYLCITIPEQWLAEAKYPVVVDPTIGTTTVGSQFRHIWDEGEPAEPLIFESSIPVNKFLVSEAINGQCTAYAYVNSDDYYAGGRPVIYSDNGDKPLTRRTMQEGLFDFRVNGSKPAGWRSATFSSNGSIASGSNIWFGVFTEYFWMPRFDYGSKCYCDWWDAYTSIPNTYPLYNANWFENFKLSMYFTYTSAQNYVRTLTQGVQLTDSRKLTAEYKRSLTEKVQANSLPARLLSVFRNIKEAIQGFDRFSASVLFLREMKDKIAINQEIEQTNIFIRGLSDIAEIESKARVGFVLTRKIADTLHASGIAGRGLLLFLRIATQVFIRDYLLSRFLKARSELELKSCIQHEIVLDSKIQ
jgi:hypothetical protein